MSLVTEAVILTPQLGIVEQQDALSPGGSRSLSAAGRRAAVERHPLTTSIAQF